MDAETLGLTVAGLVAKRAWEKVGDQAGGAAWGLLGRVSERLRALFTTWGDEAGIQALEVVEAAPDSQRAVESLAGEVARVAEQNPAGAQELQGLVSEVESTGDPRVVNFVNQVRDQARVGRIVQVTGDYYER